MREPTTTRTAAEAFSLLTGLDLEEADLAGDEPEEVDEAPNDDPADPNVAFGPEAGLPWPNVEAVASWAQSSALASGRRHLRGRPLDGEACEAALDTAPQHHRQVAALERTFLIGGPIAPW